MVRNVVLRPNVFTNGRVEDVRQQAYKMLTLLSVVSCIQVNGVDMVSP